MIIFRFIVLLFSLQSFVLDKDEIKAKLNEIIPDEISVDIVEDTYSPNFFSVELSDGSLFYVTADGEFIINGDLYQIEKNSLINFSDIRDSKKRKQISMFLLMLIVGIVENCILKSQTI